MRVVVFGSKTGERTGDEAMRIEMGGVASNWDTETNLRLGSRFEESQLVNRSLSFPGSIAIVPGV
jgi:hypothetical protein